MLRAIPVLLITFFFCTCLNAQQADSSYAIFVPGEKLLFEDNFSTEAADQFPLRWIDDPCSEMQNVYVQRVWTVQKEDDGPLLRSTNTFVHITPRLPSFPKDSFTIEFDCLLEDGASCAELYFLPVQRSAPCKQISVHLLSWGKLNIFYQGDDPKYSSSFPGDFDHTEWHHFALSYCNKELNCYTDGRLTMHIPDCGFEPASFSLGCIAPVKFRYFTVGRLVANNSLNDILTKRKFITHAIHFDYGRSTIRHESMGFIRQLAAFMQINPSLNLRIEGHTDGDGSAAGNMALSQARAEEVKKLLANESVDPQRITTKGYGASKPLKPNTSPENKAENRRVEFIRL